MSELKLTLEDKQSQVWKKIKDYCADEIYQHRINLEADQSPERTATLRGSIRSLNKLLSLENVPATVEEGED